ncbi:uncharacterized protein [Amphiura filiformis]|uniref:uncharacterized protein isoform X2 n=1 Tax=Amphiura filiformis TaxID=82378 RepID=UPI003B20DADB
MELHHIFLIIVMMCRVESALHRNSRSANDDQRCEVTCEECFANHEDSLKRMGCLEKCIENGADHFTCPGKQAFLSAVTTLSPLLRREIEEFFTKRTNMFSPNDFAGVAATFTDNSLIIIDDQKPVIGRAERAKQLSDYFTANPDLDHAHFAPVTCGTEHGIIWVNGIQTNYNKEGDVISSLRFMTLLTRVDAKLQESILVLF